MIKLIVTISTILISIFLISPANAQQYKLKQVSNLMNLKTESTVYVKGMRKRTEGGAMMGMGGNMVTIEQCDLQRTIKLNDKKKLYFIENFAQANEEVIDEENGKEIIQNKKNNVADQKGGIINMWYNITDTGERKKMFGITARHVWTSQKIKPSPEACSMKDSILIKTDGWYIDLPQFNCPVHYRPARQPQPNQREMDCKDRFITHRRGKGKLGFPLSQTTTIIMGNGSSQEMQTALETIELSTDKLDSMLFEIPPGYELAKSEADLQDKMNLSDMMKGVQQNNPSLDMQKNEMKKPGHIRIGVFAPTGNDQVQAGILQQHITGTLTNGNVEAITVSDEAEARKLNCDYTLSAVFTNIKQAGNKIGGLLKAIKNADPNATSSFNIQANLALKTLSDGTVRNQSVDGKYEGRIDDAAGKALDEGCRLAMKTLK